MRPIEDLGLTVAEAGVDEALAARRAGVFPQVTLLRVVQPPRHRWAELMAAGFVCKPSWLTWVAATPGSDEELLGRLSRSSAHDLREATARAADLRFEVRQPVGGAEMDVFFDIYERSVAEMRYGFAYARRLRDRMVDAPEYLAVFAYDGAEMVGGVLAWESAGDDAVRLRYSGVRPQWRDASLSRVLYLHAFRAARERGRACVTLGNDPNLFGHVAKPGLLLFKSRLGFVPEPAARLNPDIAGDAAELLISLDELTDPSLILGYASELPGAGLALYAYGSRPDFRAGSSRFGPVRRMSLPDGRP